MSSSVPRIQLPKNEEPDQLPIVPEPKTIGEATRQMHDCARRMDGTLRRLEQTLQLRGENPEMRTVVINPMASAIGPFVTLDQVPWTAKSIGILNPSTAAVRIGIAGISTADNSRAPQCPPQAAMTLPVQASDLEFGVASSVGALSVVVYVFRYVTVQPLMLRDMT
jgi:hypothetical protein